MSFCQKNFASVSLASTTLSLPSFINPFKSFLFETTKNSFVILVDFLLRYLVFSIGPLALELVLLSVFLLWKLDLWYVLVLFGTIAVYVWFTFKVTEYRVKWRREMNKQDTDAAQKAIDSLLNFETVKYFGAEAREAKRYDAAMAGYEAAALKTSYSLAALNFGQAFLITAGIEQNRIGQRKRRRRI